jgi:hypothetical protein
MKSKRYLRPVAVFGGGAIALGAFLIVNYQFGNIASASDMEQAAMLGGALGGALALL